MATGPTWSKPRCPGEFPGFWTSVRIDSGGKFITCMGGMWPLVGIRIPIIYHSLSQSTVTEAFSQNPSRRCLSGMKRGGVSSSLFLLMRGR